MKLPQQTTVLIIIIAPVLVLMSCCLFAVMQAPPINPNQETSTTSIQQQIPMQQSMPQAMPAQQGPDTSESIEKIGIQGNWVKKREWLIKGYEALQEIQEITLRSEQTRKMYTDAYHEINNALDAYYQQLGLEEGKVHELFDNIKSYLEKKRSKEIAALGIQASEKSDPDLQAKIDIIEQSINEPKQKLEQLLLDMKSITDLDKSLSDRIKRVDEQIDFMQNETARAKEIANDMWSIIDHQKAREQYYELKHAILEKIKNIQLYLSEELYKDFEAVIATIQKQIATTEDQIKNLENTGLFIKDRAQRVKELKIKELQEKQQHELALAQKATILEQKPKPSNWYDIIYTFFITFLENIKKIWLQFKTRFFGAEKTPVNGKSQKIAHQQTDSSRTVTDNHSSV